MGIFVPTPKYLIGLRKVEEVDMGFKDKDASGKNTKDAIDFKVYTLARFAKLALDNNPNILDVLFVNKENIVFINEVGRDLLDLRHKFLSKRVRDRFIGYANSQKHKMVIKLDNFEKVNEARDYINEKGDQFRFLLELIENTHHPLFVKKKDHVTIGDLNVPVTATIKRVKSILDDRASKFSSRKELITKYGFDSKFGSHLIRLLNEGQELLTTGDLRFPLESVELLKDIRSGKYSMNKVIELADDIKRNVDDLYETNNTLPSKPDFNTIENFVMNVHKKYILED